VLGAGNALPDSNADGIPDGWLEQYFPGKTADDVDGEGYTLLEVYLNSLVSTITLNQNSDAITVGVDTPFYSHNDINIQLQADSQVLKIEAEDAMNTIRVMDITGRMLNDTFVNAHSKEINIAHFPGGMYLVQVSFTGFVQPYVTKIIKQ